jgi:hypothetical protein
VGIYEVCKAEGSEPNFECGVPQARAATKPSQGSLYLYKYIYVIVFQNMSTVDPISNRRNKVEMVYFSALIQSLLSRTSELTIRGRPESPVRLPSFGNSVDYPVKKKDLRWFRRNVRVWQASKSEMPEMWFVITPSDGIDVLGLSAGTIQRTGPSYSHFISSSDATKNWDAQILDTSQRIYLISRWQEERMSSLSACSILPPQILDSCNWPLSMIFYAVPAATPMSILHRLRKYGRYGAQKFNALGYYLPILKRRSCSSSSPARKWLI